MENPKAHPQCEQSALYALGILDGEELDSFEQHLREGCLVCQKELSGFKPVVDQLGLSSAPVSPPSLLREKILERVHQQDQTDGKARLELPQGEDSPAGLKFVRATDDAWKAVLPGILLKTLHMDTRTGRMSALARMASGSCYKAHRHTAPEEFFVLEGSCLIGAQLLHVGDYHRAEAGSVHYETFSQEGCLMFTIFSPNNEILQTTES